MENSECSFFYPQEIEQFSNVKGKQQLKQLLKEQKLAFSVPFQYFQIFQQKKKQGTYLYARCHRCNARLRYKWIQNQQIFALTFSKTLHEHTDKRKRCESTKLVEDFIKQFPMNAKLNILKQIVVKKYNIHPSTFYNIHKKIWQKNITFQMYIDELAKKNEVRAFPFPLPSDSIPDIFVVSTPKMVKNFEKFGQFCSFDITYNLIKEIKIDADGTTRTWGLGLFLGKNNLNNPIPFAICIINSQRTEDFIGLFRSFLDIMKKQPSAIITDQQNTIKYALAALKQSNQWNGSHLFDTFHVLKSLRKKLKKGPRIFQKLRQAMFATRTLIYEENVRLAEEFVQTQEEKNAVLRFVGDAKMHCISKTPKVFHGCSLSTSFHEKTNDYIKEYIQYEKPAIQVIEKTLKLMEDLDAKSGTLRLKRAPVEQAFGYFQLKLVRLSVCETIFKRIVRNYMQALELVPYMRGDFWCFENASEQEASVWYRNEKLECSCGYGEKTGIPCCHIMKICKIMKGNLLDCVHPRWKIEEQEEKGERIVIKRGRTRNSRKNKL